MAYKVIILYQLYMPSYFLGTFTEYPYHIDIGQVFDMPAEDLEFSYSYTIPGMVSGVHLVERPEHTGTV